ncbi:ABC-2 family transporter protein [Thalassoglobus neptunius]|uniref:ABC-2 family transporter protein n=1 Tax=Thalassoglobus neptunius TaxID=1938619 RepID=A0A5C5X4F8_9PLAN|nr:hypothetical protein [Thalassoglobus neptunius]TWT57469.1 ABC-2 family transporter protein [Thalassoglobus neptunius]
MARNQTIGLPLLAKEMIEQSARKRTYVVRSVYAILLFGFATLIFSGQIYDRVTSPMQLLGKGREMFFILTMLQIVGIALFTPALTCGAITTEKERNTIGLLFLTRLGPWTILLEKYFGRLILMGTYLLISLPLFGFCYALGGVEQAQVWYGFYALTVLVIELASLAILCSTYFRTTVNAFIATYLIGIALAFGPVFLIEGLGIEIVRVFFREAWSLVDMGFAFFGRMGQLALVGTASFFGSNLDGVLDWQPHSYFSVYDRTLRSGFTFFCPVPILEASDSVAVTTPSWQILAMGIPSLAISALFLLMARYFLVWRAFASPRRYLVLFFQSLDRLFQKANQNRVTQGIVLVRESSSLPVYQPVAWRETTKTSLGSFRYLLRIFIALEFPVVAVCAIAIATSVGSFYSNRHPAIAIMVFLCWIIAILLTVVRSASLVAGERSHETLDVLLTTPITSQQLISQKFQGVMRLMFVVATPLLTAMVMQAWYGMVTDSGSDWSRFFNQPERSPSAYLFASSLMAVLSLPMFAWLSLLMGLWMKSSTKAIFSSLAIIVAWMVIPMVVLITLFEMFHVGRHDGIVTTLMMSPVVVPFLHEISELDDLFDSHWPIVLANILMYGCFLSLFRYLCYKNGARLLGRSEDNWS